MSNVEQKKAFAIGGLIIAVLLILVSSVCFFIGDPALKKVTIAAITSGVKPEDVVSLVICFAAPIACLFSMGIVVLSYSAKTLCNLKRDWTAAAKKFVAAKVIAYQDLSDEACKEKIIQLSSTQPKSFQEAVQAELAVLNFR
ncbi:hypothetical protein V0M98_36030 (plasmid) [Pseudomonas silesiensis]|uniref:hypothetical protein n=1 Tax=Pseudomonas silesiensis TaxID=1853130 RepID=UPI0030CF28C1